MRTPIAILISGTIILFSYAVGSQTRLLHDDNGSTAATVESSSSDGSTNKPAADIESRYFVRIEFVADNAQHELLVREMERTELAGAALVIDGVHRAIPGYFSALKSEFKAKIPVVMPLVGPSILLQIYDEGGIFYVELPSGLKVQQTKYSGSVPVIQIPASVLDPYLTDGMLRGDEAREFRKQVYYFNQNLPSIDPVPNIVGALSVLISGRVSDLLTGAVAGGVLGGVAGGALRAATYRKMELNGPEIKMPMPTTAPKSLPFFEPGRRPGTTTLKNLEMVSPDAPSPSPEPTSWFKTLKVETTKWYLRSTPRGASIVGSKISKDASTEHVFQSANVDDLKDVVMMLDGYEPCDWRSAVQIPMGDGAYQSISVHCLLEKKHKLP